PEDEPDPEVGYTEETGAPKIARINDVKMVQLCIEEMKAATLENSGMSQESIERMRNPRAYSQRTVTPFELCGLRMYLARGDSSEANFQDHHFAFAELHPEDNIPSYDQIKAKIVKLTGIEPVVHHMCVNSCLAYTGPFKTYTHCPIC
ncbi:hypothetical protein C8Q76DRAFT_582627, partial [Earliella scabrosa]